MGLALLLNFPKQGVTVFGGLGLAQQPVEQRTIAERELGQQILAGAGGGGRRGGWNRVFSSAATG